MMKQSLGGLWSLRRADEETVHEAQVPGSVYSALLADGTTPDPYYRENEFVYLELMDHDWVFSRGFEVTPELLAQPRVLLNCQGLDTLAHVTVNGVHVADADNMHITWCWDVKALLQPGMNTIEIAFDSPMRYVLAEDAKRPCWGSTDAVPGFSHLRKAHCMFGWDWGPRLPDCGIWREIELLGVESRILTV